jgi:outer membrane protein assembly factor BamB
MSISPSSNIPGDVNLMFRTSLAITCFLATLSGNAMSEMRTNWSSTIEDAPAAQAGKLLATASYQSDTFLLSINETLREFFVARVDASGRIVWQSVADDPTRDSYLADYFAISAFGSSMTIDASGNPIISYSCGSLQYQSSSGCLTKFDALDGRALWRKRASSGNESCTLNVSPNDGFFRQCGNSGLQKFDSFGVQEWLAERPRQNNDHSAMLPNGDFAYIGNYRSGDLVVVDGESGHRRWSRVLEPSPSIESSSEARSLLALADGSVLVQFSRSDGSDRLYRVSPQGNVMWNHTVPAFVGSSPRVQMVSASGVIVRYVYGPSSEPDRLVATNLHGDQLWTRLSSNSAERLHATTLSVYLFGNDAVVRLNSQTGETQAAYTPATNSAQWVVTPIEDTFVAQHPIDSGSTKSAFFRYKASDFSQLWRNDGFAVARNRLPLCNPQVLANGDLLVTSYALTSPTSLRFDRVSASNGQVQTLANVQSSVGCPTAFSDSEDYYVFQTDGTLNRVQPNGNVAWSQQMPGFNAGHYVRGVYRLGTSRLLSITSSQDGNLYAWRYERNGAPVGGKIQIDSAASATYFFSNADESVYLLNTVGRVWFLSTTGSPGWTISAPENEVDFLFERATTTRNGDLALAYASVYGTRFAKLRKNGDIEWRTQPTAPDLATRSTTAIAESLDGEIVFAGCSSYFGRDGRGERTWLRRVGENGAVLDSYDLDVFARANECPDGIVSSKQNDAIFVAVSSDARCNKSALVRVSGTHGVEHASTVPLAQPSTEAKRFLAGNDDSIYAYGTGYDPITRLPATSVRSIAPSALSCELDVNGDGSVSVSDDAIPLIRSMFGFSSTTAGDNQIEACHFGPEVQSVRAKYFIGSARPNDQPVYADVDGDGRALANVDGLILLRALLGVPDQQLLGTVILPSAATRTTGGEIKRYLAGCGLR